MSKVDEGSITLQEGNAILCDFGTLVARNGNVSGGTHHYNDCTTSKKELLVYCYRIILHIKLPTLQQSTY